MLRTILGLLAFTLLSPAHAGEAYDNCTGTISSVPVTISTPGTWCLTANKFTSLTSGAAITITASNVSIDCNNFRISNLSGGPSTNAAGVLATNMINTAIRRCGLRGFQIGIRLAGTNSAGAVLEHNRLEQNTDAGIVMSGSGHRVLFNSIDDTGGRPSSSQSEGILSTATHSQITDNSLIGMTVTLATGDVVGISATGNANEIARNFISALVPGVDGDAFGIVTGAAQGSSIHRNQLLSYPDVIGTAIMSSVNSQCGNNNHSGWDSGVVGCTDAGGNFGN
jgi:hypothetical protein